MHTGKICVIGEAFEGTCQHWFRAPYSLGEQILLPAGLELELDGEVPADASAIRARPVEYAAWEPLLVPGSVRSSGKYDGYSLVIDRHLLDTRCTHAEEKAATACPAMRLFEAFRGCLLGTAVGDAIGLPFEGMSAHRIARFHPFPLRHRFFFGRGLCSDDAEHTAMVGQSIAESGGDVRRFSTRLASRLRWWLLGLPAGIGLATLRSILKLWMGFPPAKSGVWSAGNGPAMRSAIIGVHAGPNEKLRRELVAASTLLTHRDPKAMRGALVVAQAAALGAAGQRVTLDQCIAAFMHSIGDDEELRELMAHAAASAERGEAARAFCRESGLDKGVSGYIYHTLPVAVQIWLRHQNDYESALTEVVACGGDTDTVGAIVGGMVGAAVGVDGIPQAWRHRLVDWPRSVSWLETLAQELTVSRLQIRKVEVPGISAPGVLIRNVFFMVWVLAHGFRRLLPPY